MGGRLTGRDEERSGVGRALGAARLVTLTGAPGIGKTQLALAVAREHRDPATVIELAPVADPALVPATLASALSVQEVPGQGLTETLVASLRRRRALLVLDNCEHQLDACRDLVAAVLSACPQVRVLATSRAPLGLEGEQVWRVPPLSLPPAGETDPEALMTYSASALFMERAGEAQPGFVLNQFVASDVAQICRRLDGLPLAIELAAARVEMLTPDEIARRIADHLSLLSDGGEGRAERHQTLEAALDWSHALLDASERALLRRLSVFAGRFGPSAATVVCGGGEVDAGGVPELLDGLVSKSLVVAGVGADEEPWYRLLETIRTYAGEKLERSGEASELRTAHARFYLSLAERAEPELTGPHGRAWLERLEPERANLRDAVLWSLSHGHPEFALRIATALVLFWRARCRFSEGRDLLAAVLGASDGMTPGLRGRALWGAGFMTFMAGDLEGAAPLLEQALALARASADERGEARALLVLGNLRQRYSDPHVLAMLEQSARLAHEAGDHWCQGDALGIAGFECTRNGELGRARTLLEECLAVSREAADPQALCTGLLGLGQVAVAQGEYAEAESLLEEAGHVTRGLGEDFGRATALRFLGVLALGRGEYQHADELLHEALALLPDGVPAGARVESLLLLATAAASLGELPRAKRLLNEVLSYGARGPSVLIALGQLALDEGDPAGARRLFEEARSVSPPPRLARTAAEALHALGELARADGDPQRAAELHREALELHRRLGDAPSIAGSLEAVAGLVAQSSGPARAARLFGAARALREREGFARPPRENERYEADIALCRESLSAGKLASALDEGATLSLEHVLSDAARELERVQARGGWPGLTKREHEVMELVAAGLTNLEIAERLVISIETVKSHLSHIFAKLGVTGRWGLAHALHSRNGGPR